MKSVLLPSSVEALSESRRCGWKNTNFRFRIESGGEHSGPGVSPNIFRYSLQLINSYHVLPACSDKRRESKEKNRIDKRAKCYIADCASQFRNVVRSEKGGESIAQFRLPRIFDNRLSGGALINFTRDDPRPINSFGKKASPLRHVAQLLFFVAFRKKPSKT